MSFTSNDKTKKLFCPLAWNHAFINQNGSLQVCCTSEEYDNHIRTEDGKKMFITDNRSLDEVMNSKYMKDLRLQLLNGEWPEICTRCKVTEKLDGSSRRMIEIMNYESRVDEMIESTAPDGEIPVKITSADYRLGNVCNLQCRMCNPRSTKLWIKDWNKLKEGTELFSEEVMESYNHYNWIDSDDIDKDFERKAGNLEHIHFAGGEPLIVPSMAKFLQKCIDSGNASNIILTYNTNLSILPEKVLQLWKHFKGVKILASIDAVGDLNHYIRYPAKWDQIDKNLKFIDEHHEEYKILECMFSTTVQVLNILHLPEIYRYLQQFKFILKAPNLINLHVPGYMQATVLPASLKLMVSLELAEIEKTIRKDLEPHYHYLLDNIHSVIKFLHHADNYTNGEFDRMLRFQRGFDDIKNLKLEDYCPEIATLAKNRKT